jgi:hypothetical protein
MAEERRKIRGEIYCITNSMVFKAELQPRPPKRTSLPDCARQAGSAKLNSALPGVNRIFHDAMFLQQYYEIPA